jgi:hypothetical protein
VGPVSTIRRDPRGEEAGCQGRAQHARRVKPCGQPPLGYKAIAAERSQLKTRRRSDEHPADSGARSTVSGNMGIGPGEGCTVRARACTKSVCSPFLDEVARKSAPGAVPERNTSSALKPRHSRLRRQAARLSSLCRGVDWDGLVFPGTQGRPGRGHRRLRRPGAYIDETDGPGRRLAARSSSRACGKSRKAKGPAARPTESGHGPPPRRLPPGRPGPVWGRGKIRWRAKLWRRLGGSPTSLRGERKRNSDNRRSFSRGTTDRSFARKAA